MSTAFNDLHNTAAAQLRTGHRRYPTTRAEHARALHIARLKRRRQRRHPASAPRPPRIVLRVDTRALNASMSELAKSFQAAGEAVAVALKPIGDYIRSVQLPPAPEVPRG